LIQNIFSSKTIAKRTLREIRILHCIDHDNIVKLQTLMPIEASARSTFTEVYVVFEIMETDLATVIKSKQTLHHQHIQIFMFQIINALLYLHRCRVVHRDLKPRNILVNSNCCLKIADFGLSRIVNPLNNTKTASMTEYVTTRWYRAPEVLVGWHSYTSAVDMWASGVILAELLGRKPIFPGIDSFNQLDLIVLKLGKPSEKFIQACRKFSCRNRLREFDARRSIGLLELYPTASPRTHNLLQKLLDMDPDHRITAELAAKHPFFSEVASELPQPLYVDADFSENDFSFEKEDTLCTDDLRREIFYETCKFNPLESFTTPSPVASFTPDAACCDYGSIQDSCMEFERDAIISDSARPKSGRQRMAGEGGISSKKVKQKKTLSSLWSGIMDIFGHTKQEVSSKDHPDMRHETVEEMKAQSSDDALGLGVVTYAKRRSFPRSNASNNLSSSDR
jgi:serine/threonine protein kinase